MFVAPLATGCATDDQIRGALIDVNNEFRQQYERILAENGTRVYKVKRQEAFNATRIVLARLAMRIGGQSRSSATSTSLRPRDPAQPSTRRRQAADRDLAESRELAKHVGLGVLRPVRARRGLEIVINSTTIEVPAGIEVSLYHAHARNRFAASPACRVASTRRPQRCAWAWTRSGASSRPS